MSQLVKKGINYLRFQTKDSLPTRDGENSPALLTAIEIPMEAIHL